jgi:hypothetical protein
MIKQVIAEMPQLMELKRNKILNSKLKTNNSN